MTKVKCEFYQLDPNPGCFSQVGSETEPGFSQGSYLDPDPGPPHPYPQPCLFFLLRELFIHESQRQHLQLHQSTRPTDLYSGATRVVDPDPLLSFDPDLFLKL